MSEVPSTKTRILDEALTLFSERGYANVYVSDIADRVGIKAPSLYKHFRNKRAIFEGILEEMEKQFLAQAGMLNITGNDAAADVAIYEMIDEDTLVKLGTDLFLYYLHDDLQRRFRKMLTIEQFQDAELAGVYQQQYIDAPINYQYQMFKMLTSSGFLKAKNDEEVMVMTMHFYAPIYLLLTVCDRDPYREVESIQKLESHIRQFNRLYGRKKR